MPRHLRCLAMTVEFSRHSEGRLRPVGIRKYQKGERIAAAGVARLAMTVAFSCHSEGRLRPVGIRNTQGTRETDCHGTCGASQ